MPEGSAAAPRRRRIWVSRPIVDEGERCDALSEAVEFEMHRKFATIGVIAAAAISAGGSARAVPLNVIFGTNGADVIYATPGPDVIYAKSGDDVINDLGDGDVLYASSGNDTAFLLCCTVVNDVRLHLNVGNDTVFGRANDSYVNAGSGNDLLHFGGCGQHVVGGSGNDTYFNSDSCPGADGSLADLGNGHDAAHLRNARRVTLGNGNDLLNSVFPGIAMLGSGNDVVDIDLGGDGVLFLGAGNDRVAIANAGNMTVYGSSGSDHIIAGHTGQNVIKTESGNDLIDLSDLSFDNDLDGGPGRDRARLSLESSGTTCRKIELVTDFDGNPRACS
jgi:Ca2+-binding RTX toxin-like protein